MNIGAILKDVRLDMPLLQLLDAAPRLRTEIAKVLAAKNHASRGRKKTATPLTVESHVAAVIPATPNATSSDDHVLWQKT